MAEQQAEASSWALTAWRLGLAAFLAAFVGVPVVLPVIGCWPYVGADWSWLNAAHLLLLSKNTMLLTAGTVALALPVGTVAALLLFRTNLPGRSLWLGSAVLLLFVPVPLLMSAWQALMGSDGWLGLAWWAPNADSRWTQGLTPAIWVHSIAGLPWVVLIVGSGLAWVERELEEEALMWAGTWRVFWHVTLPRCRGHVLAAGLWLALDTMGEISITYFLQVSTFAEQIHTQLSVGGPEALARSVVLALPGALLLWLMLLLLVPRLERTLPPLDSWLEAAPLVRLGRGRWLLAGLLGVLGLVVFVLPLFGLVWKLGLAGWPQRWSPATAWHFFGLELRLSSGKVVGTIVICAATALWTAELALVCCWLARGCRWLGVFLLTLLTLAWVLPGTVVGIGLRELILELEGVEVLAQLLYRGPSPLPVMWAQAIRFLPVAVALLWPVVRMMPRDLSEAARLEGAGAYREFVEVVRPLAVSRLVWTALVVTALCLGDIAVSSRVETPGWPFFQMEIFQRMHYGVENAVAALCLVLLAWLAVLGGVGAALWRGATRGGP